jgi:hypothetical protein
VLAPDYLEQALRVETQWPILGAWCGDVVGEFETQPDPWMHPLLAYISIRECKEARWSNNPGDWSAIPFGTGLCIRAEVAALYARQQTTRSPERILDRRGSSLMSAEDIDMVLYCRKLALGFGRFPELRMTHLIPARRLSEDYPVELVRAVSRSTVLACNIHGYAYYHKDRWRDSALGSLLHFIRHGRRSLRIRRARLNGIRDGLRVIQGLTPANPPQSALPP